MLSFSWANVEKNKGTCFLHFAHKLLIITVIPENKLKCNSIIELYKVPVIKGVITADKKCIIIETIRVVYSCSRLLERITIHGEHITIPRRRNGTRLGVNESEDV